jgi:hypothetical protein
MSLVKNAEVENTFFFQSFVLTQYIALEKIINASFYPKKRMHTHRNFWITY